MKTLIRDAYRNLAAVPEGALTVTLSLPGLASNLPPPEQRRLATTFLAKKALLLTIVATATSRLPVRGSKASVTTSNSSRRVDLSAMLKEPFFQRAHAPPAPEPEASPAGKPNKDEA